jgi:photosystem II stability/assembly factor-like uncharacterized protein
MRVLCGLPVLVALASSLVAAPPDRWTTRGAGGGGAMFEPCYSPHDPDELWVACDMGSFHVTKDAGVSWRTVPCSQLQGNSRTAVRFTMDKDLLWSLDTPWRRGSEMICPSVSLDAGRTWTRLGKPHWPDNFSASNICVDFQRPERLLIAAQYHSLLFSRDAGRSFQTVRENKTTIRLAGAFFSEDEILACTSHEGMLRSTDNGKTWREHPATGIPRGEYPGTFVAAGSGAKRRLFVITVSDVWPEATGTSAENFRGLYVLDPDSNKWEKRQDGLKGRPFFVAASPKDPDIAYAAGMSPEGEEGPCICKTTNGGKTWVPIFQTKQNANITSGWAGFGGKLNWSWPGYALGLAVAPTDPDRVAVTDLGCVHQTKDGGKTWEQLYTNTKNPHLAGEKTPRDDSYSSRGLEVTSCWDVAWFGPQNVFVGYSDISGLVSDDGGTWWRWPAGHTENTAYHVLVTLDGKGYLAGGGIHDLYQSTRLEDKPIDNGTGYVMVSDDKGATWKMLKDFKAPVVRLAQHPKQPETLYACVVNSQRGGIYRTTELGKGLEATWTQLAAPELTSGHPYSLQILDDGTLVCTYSGHIMRGQFSAGSGVYISTDGGKSWQDRSDPGMRYWTKDLVLDHHDRTQSTWYVGVYHAWGANAQRGKSGLYRTTDRGKTWHQILQKSSGLSGLLNVESVTFHPTRPGILYMTTENDGLWWTDDLRKEKPTFFQVTSYPFKHPTRVFFNPHQLGEIWVTSFGSGLFVGKEVEKKP